MNLVKLIISTILLTFILIQCKAKKTAPLKIIPFDFPDDMTEAGKPAFVKSYNQGHILYNMNCARCHNKVENGQSVIPDFSLPQLMDYEIRIQYPDHQDPMRETNITQEELEKVIIFLRYKKKNVN